MVAEARASIQQPVHCDHAQGATAVTSRVDDALTHGSGWHSGHQKKLRCRLDEDRYFGGNGLSYTCGYELTIKMQNDNW